MIWRLVKFLFAAICLLSLSACIGTGWLWRHTKTSGGEWLRICGHGVYFSVSSDQDGLGIESIKRLPVSSPFRFAHSSGLDDDNQDNFTFDSSAQWKMLAWQGQRGSLGRMYVGNDGAPVPWRIVDPVPLRWPKDVREIDGLTFWTVEHLPHRQVMIAFVLPMLLWIGSAVLPLRRILIRRHRDRHGLCRSCSYDLKGNTSGVCPECGEKIAPRVEGMKA